MDGFTLRGWVVRQGTLTFISTGGTVSRLTFSKGKQKTKKNILLFQHVPMSRSKWSLWGTQRHPPACQITGTRKGPGLHSGLKPKFLRLMGKYPTRKFPFPIVPRKLLDWLSMLASEAQCDNQTAFVSLSPQPPCQRSGSAESSALFSSLAQGQELGMLDAIL